MWQKLLILACLATIADGLSKGPRRAVPGSYIFYADGSKSTKGSMHAASIRQFFAEEMTKMAKLSSAKTQSFSIGLVEGIALHHVAPDDLKKLSARADELGISVHPNYVVELDRPLREKQIFPNMSTAAGNVASSSSSSSQCLGKNIFKSGYRLHHLDWLDLHYGDPSYCGPAQSQPADRMDVFVLDSGIDNSHPDFAHITIYLEDCNDGTANPWTNYTDVYGHGTHVSGIVASKTAGVTPNVNLHVIKVFSDNATTSTSTLLCGMNKLQTWLTNNPSKKTVVDFSFRTADTAVESAVNSLLATNGNRTVLVVSAGNEAYNACAVSFPHVPKAIFVGSVDEFLMESWFTNYGSCVDVMASGENVLSTWPGGLFMLDTGTSMAAPLVTGVIAQFWLEHATLTGDAIRNKIAQPSSELHESGKLLIFSPGTPNKLIKYSCPGGCANWCSSICKNGATCLSNNDCHCAPGYSGTSCEVSACTSQPCQHGGACAVFGSEYVCTCPSGYFGLKCEQKDPCTPTPCLNGGGCSASGSQYTCICFTGFIGSRCETNSICSSQPCRNGGTCKAVGNGFSCSCPADTIGNHCEFKDYCFFNPCKNGGKCLGDSQGISCQCASGFSGKRCESNINECESKPCRNGGTCTDDANRYDCKCRPGFIGSDCSWNAYLSSPCLSSPCQNGGVCSESSSNAFTCECSANYTGNLCSLKASPCTKPLWRYCSSQALPLPSVLLLFVSIVATLQRK